MFRLVAAVVLVGALGGVAAADPPVTEPRRALVVGVKPSPPFATQAADGTWSGISIELMRMVATDLGVQFSVQSFEYVPALIEAVHSGQVDVGVGALTVTAERRQKVDFTRPIYATGLAIAVAPPRRAGALGAARHLLRWELGAVVAVVLALGAGVAAAVRRRGRTTATMGLATAWALVAIVAVAAVTASVTARATALEIAARVEGPDDLAGARVATVPGSTSAAYLDERRLPYRPVATAAEGLRALAGGDVDAVVYDEPILHKLATGDVDVLPGVFEHQEYAFALRQGSELRADMDKHLEARLAGDGWKALVEQHLP